MIAYKDDPKGWHKEYNRERYEANREEKLSQNKAWRDANPEKQKAATSAWQKENKDRVNESSRQWRAANPEANKESKRKSNVKHRAKRREEERAWRAANRDHVNARSRKYVNNRLKTDPQFKIAWYTRIRMRNVLKGIRKSASTLALLGCTLEHAKAHIEAQFAIGMTWDNWAEDGWVLDHIRPLASFDLADPAQQAQAFHYTNLQPLWGPDNAAKGTKLDWNPTISTLATLDNPTIL